LNVGHFKTVEAMGLKIMAQCHDLPAEFMKIHQLFEKLLAGGQRGSMVIS
jgi:hypothetical protein